MAGKRWTGALLFAALAAFMGCGGCGSQPEYCKGLELTASEGEPLDLIPISLDLEVDEGEEPIEVGQLFAEVEAKGIDGVYYTPIEQDPETKDYSLIVPAHPEGIEGGKVKLKIHGSDGSCGGWEKFEILPLAPAPGTFDEVIDGLTRVIEVQTERLGYAADDLVTDAPDELPEPLWGHAAYRDAIDSDDNANSLRKLASNDAEVDVSEGLELANALLAKAKMVEHLDATVAALEAVEEPDEMLQFGMDQPFRTRRQALQCDEVLIYPKFSGAGPLSFYMKLADSTLRELEDGDAGRLDTAGTLIGLAQHPAAKAVSIILTTLAHRKKATALAYANTLPSTLYEPEIDPSRSWFEEDSEESGTWKDTYTVMAASNGWDATGTILEGVIQAIDSVIGTKGLADEIGQAVRQGSLAGDLATVAASNGSKAWFSRFEGGCVVPVREWGPINVSGTAWSEVDYELAIKQTQGDRWSYEPKEVGTGTITVNVVPEAFPPASNKLASLLVEPVEVREILVTLDPGYGRIEPGDSIDVIARVQYAVDKNVKFTLVSPREAGASVEEIGVDDDGNEIARVTAPMSVDDYPVVVKARSLSIGGIRDQNSEERSGFGIYNAEQEIIIRPSFACVKPGETEDYEAIIAGSDDATLTWTTSGGSISGTTDEATYTARQDGLFEIKATHEGMGVSDTATVVVNRCECEYDVVVSGAALAQFGHHIGIQATTTGNSLSMTMTHPDGSLAQINSLQEAGMGVNPGQPGEYIAAGSITLPDARHVVESFFTLGGDDPQDEGWGRLTIEEWDEEENYFSGFFVGRAILLTTVGLPEDERIWVDIAIRFRSFVTKSTDIWAIAEGANCDIATNEQ